MSLSPPPLPTACTNPAGLRAALSLGPGLRTLAACLRQHPKPLVRAYVVGVLAQEDPCLAELFATASEPPT